MSIIPPSIQTTRENPVDIHGNASLRRFPRKYLSVEGISCTRAEIFKQLDFQLDEFLGISYFGIAQKLSIIIWRVKYIHKRSKANFFWFELSKEKGLKVIE